MAIVTAIRINATSKVYSAQTFAGINSTYFLVVRKSLVGFEHSIL